MPSKVAATLERIQRRFLWSSDSNLKKAHYVKWADVAKPKSHGGVGIKALIMDNKDLIAKWWWRYHKQKDDIWVKIIDSIYKNFTWPNLPDSKKQSTVWSGITSMANNVKGLRHILFKGLVWKIGDGKSIRFWEFMDNDGKSMEAKYPRLFQIAIDKNTSLSDGVHLLTASNSNDYINVFRRKLFLWEERSLQELINEISCIELRVNASDEIIWHWDPGGVFSFSSVYNTSFKLLHEPQEYLSNIWDNNLHPKIIFFLWLAIKNATPTKVMLQNRNIIQDPNFNVTCVNCNADDEDSDHLFCKCSFSWKLWSSVIEWWNFRWCCPANIRLCYLWWWSADLKGIEKLIWKMSFLSVIWEIWSARNMLIFKGKAPSIESSEILIKVRVAKWAVARWNFSFYSINDFIYNLDVLRKMAKGKESLKSRKTIK